MDNVLGSAGIEFSQEAERRCSQDSWPEPAKGIFDTIWHHAQYTTGGAGWGGGGIMVQEWAEHWVLGGEQQHYASLASYILLLVLLLLFLLSLCCPYLNPGVFTFFFWFSSLSHQWVAALCLNRDTWAVRCNSKTLEVDKVWALEGSSISLWKSSFFEDLTGISQALQTVHSKNFVFSSCLLVIAALCKMVKFQCPGSESFAVFLRICHLLPEVRPALTVLG